MKYFEIPIPYKVKCTSKSTPANYAAASNIFGVKQENCTTPHQQNFIINKCPIFPGWYMLELNINSDTEYVDATLSTLGPNDKHKSKHYQVLLIPKRTTKRVVYIPSSRCALNLSLNKNKAPLIVTQLSLTKLSTSKALKMMHKKLKTFEPDKKFSYSLQLWRHYENFFRQQQTSETDYETWLKNREYTLIKKKFHMSTSLSFSIILNTSHTQKYNTLENLITSLTCQTYTNWKIILIIPKEKLSTDTSKLLMELEKTNKIEKIIVLTEKKPLKISKLIDKVNGDYFLHLNNNTVLPKYTLSVFARFIQKNDLSDVVYSDHDMLDTGGVRTTPSFKSDWNPDLVLSNNYIGNSFVFNKAILEKLQYLPLSSNSTWVYEILIYCVFSKKKVSHIPLILNHNTSSSDTYTSEDQLKVLNKYLLPLSAVAKNGKTNNTFRVIWPTNNNPLVSIIIPTRDGLHTLKRTIDSIFARTTYECYEIIIIDNQSRKKETKEYLEILSLHERIKVLTYNKPFNYSAINNFAVSHATGSVLTLLNNDVQIISPNWLTELVSHTQREDIGCVGAMLYYPDERIQHAGVIIGLGGCAGHSHKFYKRGSKGYTGRLVCTQNYSAVTGACLALRKSVFIEVHGLNEENLAVAFNDVDLCLKVQAKGYRNLWTPWAELYHYESLSRGEDNTKSKRKRLNKEVAYMKDTWNTTKSTDPYYNTHLTSIREDFSLGLKN